MSRYYSCYWSNSRDCKKGLFDDTKDVFIIGSCDQNREEYIEEIKNIIEEVGLNPIFAEDLKENTNLDAFCDNICSHIRGSLIIINDISAPLKYICKKCETSDFVPSLNVYWEYGYAAGMGKPQIVICDEEQFDKIPFDVAGKQILKYTRTTLKDILKPLIEMELTKPIQTFRSQVITLRDENFSEKIQEIEQEILEYQNVEIDLVRHYDEGRYHILFGLTIIPFNNNLTILDLKNEEIDDFIKDLQNRFFYSNPYRRRTEFSNFLRNFKYNREFYESELTINTNYGYNHSKIDIAQSGRINHLIIYDVPRVMDINPSENYYDESKREEFDNSLLLSSVLPPYLFLMWLKLAKLIFDIGKFKGEFCLLLRILANRSISLWYKYKDLGQNDIYIKEIINTDDLSKKKNLRKVLDNLLMELLRYFNYDLKDKDKGMAIFNDTIKDYIDFVFK